MELCIHRMFTSGVICQSNLKMSGKFRKWCQDYMYWKEQLVDINGIKIE